MSSHDTIVIEVVALFKEERLSQKLSIRRLADLASLSRSGIGDIESGRTKPTLLSLLMMADALGIRLDSVIGTVLDSQKE